MQIDPIEYPTIPLGGKQYELKFRCGDVIRLKKDQQIDIFAMQTLQGVEAMQRTCVLISAAISHVETIAPEAIADMIDFADLPVFSAALNEAIKKVAARVPPATPPTNAPAIQ